MPDQKNLNMKVKFKNSVHDFCPKSAAHILTRSILSQVSRYTLIYLLAWIKITFSLSTGCLNTSCENGGECIDGVCVCQPGYTGQFCESGILILLKAYSETPLCKIVLLVPLHVFYYIFHRARHASHFSHRTKSHRVPEVLIVIIFRCETFVFDYVYFYLLYDFDVEYWMKWMDMKLLIMLILK